MTFKLPDLPYAMNALAPHISEETLEYHYGKHHQAYVNNLNKLISDTENADKSLEEIILSSSNAIFNNAAQTWNHTFYWHCLSPNGGDKPHKKLLDALENQFGSFDAFKEAFTKAAAGHFGAGWAWLTKSQSGELEIFSTANAGTPMTQGKKALLTCDVWEHAYYIDTRNDRGKYIGNFWELVNWDFVNNNFTEN